MSATAVRSGSVAARRLLVEDLDEVLDAARRGDRLRPGVRPGVLGVRPGVLGALARTIALQDRSPGDRQDALAVYTLIRTAFGAGALSPANQALHAQLTLAWDGPEKVPALLAAYRRMSRDVRAALDADLCNPFVASREPEPWLAMFQALLPDPPPTLGAGANLCAFDRLGPDTPPARVEAPQRVSVVITTHRPGEGLITSVRSILAQTWSNVEVIVVDDGSPPRFQSTFQRLGRKVRVIRLDESQGTYAARNIGLGAAGGEFVAFQDSGDWSHPRRLERQVAPLLADPQLAASTSDGLSVTADLLLSRPGLRTLRFNSSSLVMRRSAVLGRVGFFDPLGEAADSEYLGRIEATLGAGAIHHLDETLALIRLTHRSEIRPNWMHPARIAYTSAYRHWHRAIADGEADPRAERPFPAPPHLLGRVADTAFDVVLAGDWRYATGPVRSAVDEMRALAAAGFRVGLVQLDSFRRAHRSRLPSTAAIQELINAGIVEQVCLGDPCTAEVLLVRQAEVLQYAADDVAALRAARVLVVADVAPEHYDPAECTARVRRVFGRPAVWCPQDPVVRASLPPGLDLTDRDLPAIVDAGGWHATRAGASPEPIVGADLCDGDPIATLTRLSDVDVRLRLADGPDSAAPGVPERWLIFPADAVAPRPFVHQLDFYLHVPHPAAAETLSRPALEAAAAGCVVILPERSAALYGDAAVYASPPGVPELVERYAADRALFAEQSRRARAVVARANHPGLFVDAIGPRRNRVGGAVVERA